MLGHELTDAGDGIRLRLTEGTWRQGIWTTFNLWLDDYLNDHIDRMAALMQNLPDPSVKGQALSTIHREDS